MPRSQGPAQQSPLLLSVARTHRRCPQQGGSRRRWRLASASRRGRACARSGGAPGPGPATTPRKEEEGGRRGERWRVRESGAPLVPIFGTWLYTTAPPHPTPPPHPSSLIIQHTWLYTMGSLKLGTASLHAPMVRAPVMPCRTPRPVVTACATTMATKMAPVCRRRSGGGSAHQQVWRAAQH